MAATTQIPITTIRTHMPPILTAIRLRSSNINMDRLRSNSSSPTVRRLPISGKGIRRSSRTAIRHLLRNRTGRNRTPRLLPGQIIRLRRRPATTSPMASGITLAKRLLS